MQFSFASICELYGTDEVFKDIIIPSSYDKEILINTILSECMMYQPLYVELPIFNQMIVNFFKLNYTNFEKLAYLYDLKYGKDYNPIWNKDGSFEEKETYTKNNTFNSNESGNDNDEQKETLNEINQVSAYDVDTFQNNNKNTNDNTIVKKTTNSKTKKDDGLETFTNSITRSEKGNIGVTTTAQMLKEEFEIQQNKKYNKYEIVANMFYDEFFIHY